MIADCNYGGRVTDDADRRLLNVYAKDIFNNNLIGPEQWVPMGTEEGRYLYPANEAEFRGGADPALFFTPRWFYEEMTNSMDSSETPACYGQHVNAEITSQILDAEAMLYSVLSITP